MVVNDVVDVCGSVVFKSGNVVMSCVGWFGVVSGACDDGGSGGGGCFVSVGDGVTGSVVVCCGDGSVGVG